jgi:hypothetical protein
MACSNPDSLGSLTCLHRNTNLGYFSHIVFIVFKNQGQPFLVHILQIPPSFNRSIRLLSRYFICSDELNVELILVSNLTILPVSLI